LCDILLPSNDASDIISSSQSRRCVSGSILQRWNTVATIPAISPR
jgi:hypothetical protein